MDDDRVLKRLKDYHTGHGNAVSGPELSKSLGISNRELRQRINNLRKAANPICSGDEGYFYAQTNEELSHTIRQLMSRVRNIADAKNGLLRAKAQFDIETKALCVEKESEKQ